MVASVPVPHHGVDGHDPLDAEHGCLVGALLGGHVAGAPGTHREVQLVQGRRYQLVHVPAVRRNPLRRDVEVCRGGVAQHDESTRLAVGAEQFFVGPSRVAARDSVAVVVHGSIVRGGSATRVHVIALVVAVVSAPVGAAQSLELGQAESVAVAILQRHVLLGEGLDLARHIVAAGVLANGAGDLGHREGHVRHQREVRVEIVLRAHHVAEDGSQQSQIRLSLSQSASRSWPGRLSIRNML